MRTSTRTCGMSVTRMNERTRPPAIDTDLARPGLDSISFESSEFAESELEPLRPEPPDEFDRLLDDPRLDEFSVSPPASSARTRTS